MVGAVIVAAGLSSRMGSVKALLPMDGTTVIEKIINTLRYGGVKKIVVVVGYEKSAIAQAVSSKEVQLVINEAFATGEMFDSAKIGLREMKTQCDSILFLPVDVPLFSVKTVHQLIYSESDLAVASYRGEPGHPVKVSSHLVDEILNYNGNQGMRGALQNLSQELVSIKVEDEGILLDMDTYAQYQHLLTLVEQEEAG